MKALPFVLFLALSAAGTVRASDLAPDLDACNVAWDAPGPAAQQSMPTGNGDIGLNVWVEPSGDLVFYISKTDSWGESNQGSRALMKVGRVRIAANPSALSPGARFSQVLRLRESEIEIKEGTGDAEVDYRVWVDANHPAIRVEAKSARPVSFRAVADDWRVGDVAVPPKAG
ncbi:MAG TPA: DUF5703 domain-containing protein, partial [Candidatus Methylacidiphilales bacterium]